MSQMLVDLVSGPVTPPFIYLHHPHQPSTSVIPELPQQCLTVQLDAIECHTPRLFYAAVLRKLGQTLESDIASLDLFLRALRSLWLDARGGQMVNGKSSSKKGKEKQIIPNGHLSRTEKEAIVLVITHAERLRNVFGPNWSVVTRMAELSHLPFTVVLASSVPWDEIRPPRGDALEPVNIFSAAPTKADILKELSHGSDHPLYPRFLDLLLATLLPLLSYPDLELEDLAEPLWQIYTSNLPPHAEQLLLNRPLPDPANPPPPLNVTVKLLTDLKHQMAIPLAAATEDLISKQIGSQEFAETFTTGAGSSRSGSTKLNLTTQDLKIDLPIAGKFLLVAAYCASYNPAKSDLRLFGRGTGPDGKRRKGGGTRRAGYGRTRIGKVPQRLLGPKPFPLDRLLAIFASLYAEHAVRPPDLEPTYEESSDDEIDDWLPSVDQARKREEKRRKRDTEREEMWDDEVDHLTMSVNLWSMIPELEGQGLLRRVSPVDRLDNIMLKCEMDYEAVKTCAKDLKVTLDDYLYEASA